MILYCALIVIVVLTSLTSKKALDATVNWFIGNYENARTGKQA
jgi:hypothetical protein